MAVKSGLKRIGACTFDRVERKVEMIQPSQQKEARRNFEWTFGLLDALTSY